MNKLKLDWERTSASIDCHIFSDTDCFGCGLCNWAREEKEYYNEFMKNYDEYGIIKSRLPREKGVSP